MDDREFVPVQENNDFVPDNDVDEVAALSENDVPMVPDVNEEYAQQWDVPDGNMNCVNG